MKLSTRGRYAVMAMADIATHSTGEPVSLGDIAVRQDISLAYLEQLFAKLRRGALVASCRGPGGGYRLAREAADIRIADIVIAVEEPLKVTRCDDHSSRGCVGGARCLTHDLWEELGRQIHVFLCSVSLEDVVQKRVLGMASPVMHARDGAAAVPPSVHLNTVAG
jgi:Rrf2 family iron-sulfur cluster assembly transcriptional regulator